MAVGLRCARWGPSGPVIGNDEVAAHCAAHPGRVVGVAPVDRSRPMEAVRERRRGGRDLGFRALRVVPWPWGPPPDDRRDDPLSAGCCELDVTFCTQVGHAGPLRASEPGRPIPDLDHVALEFPELRIVGGHVGVPWLPEVISLRTKDPNVHVDASASAVARHPAALVASLRGPGRHKVLFGSNLPFWPAADRRVGLDDLALDDAPQRLFPPGNARRVFRLDA